MIQVQCPHCHRGLKAPEKFAGRKSRCPSCQSEVVIPSLPATGETNPKPASTAKLPETVKSPETARPPETAKPRPAEEAVRRKPAVPVKPLATDALPRLATSPSQPVVGDLLAEAMRAEEEFALQLPQLPAQLKPLATPLTQLQAMAAPVAPRDPRGLRQPSSWQHRVRGCLCRPGRVG
jgi:hypothetical protein